jgi:hypothetical protein
MRLQEVIGHLPGEETGGIAGKTTVSRETKTVEI